jgi:glucose/arabinose dehydrogenase
MLFFRRRLPLWQLSISLFCFCFLASGTLAQNTAADSPVLTPTLYVAGFSRPIQLTHAGDGSQRLFVVEQNGHIRIIKNQALIEKIFLDISNRVSCCGERGLLGLAFPPNYVNKGYFYVNYTNSDGDTVVARYHITTDPEVADPNSEEILLTIAQPFTNHNGGHLAFGPDGYLYIGTGDGGSGGDPHNNGQSLSTLLGKILRIDVESGTTPYAIPATNPFAVSTADRREIWAFGLRNPWKFSFDRQTGNLYIGDVGQNTYEEIDFQPASSPGGANYGWKIMEGTHCYNASSCNQSGLTLPVVEYDHEQGCSVTGGIVYRGQRFPRLNGTYLYGDYCTGRIWGLTLLPTSQQNVQLFDASYPISAFGEDEAGEVYLTDYEAGAIYQVTDANSSPNVDLEITTSDTPDPAIRGENLTTTITITNRGSLPTTLVQTNVMLPSTFVLTSATSSQGECSGTSTVTCTLGTIPPSTPVTITITSTPTVAGGFSTIATVSSHEPDVRPENNSATAVTTVPEGPSINPTGPDLAGAWQSITQRCKGSGETKKCTVRGAFVVENRGQQKASSTLLRFYLSSNATFDSGDTFIKDSQVNTLKIGRTKQRNLKMKLPPGTDATGQIVIAVLDSAEAVIESNETNNTIASPPLP